VLEVVARHREVWLIADDIYEHLVYDEVTFVAPLQVRPGLSCVTPGGAFYAFPSWKALIGSVTPRSERLETDGQFCRYLLEEFGVAVVPGAPFGAPGHFRISYASSPDVLREAMARLQTACSTLTPVSPAPR
jgi:aspartate aminotransferase